MDIDLKPIDSNINIQKNYKLEEVIAEQQAKYDDDKYFFDVDEAHKLYKFVSLLTLDKGKKGQKVKLLKFQFLILSSILCVKHRDTKYRRFKEAHLNISRKNGKGSLVSWIILYTMYTQPVFGAEYIIVANTTDQAKNLYNTLAVTIKSNRILNNKVKITESRKLIEWKKYNITLRVLSNEGSNLDSYAGYIVVLDEIHEYADDAPYAKLSTGMGLWDEPLIFTTTTASSGEDKANLEVQKYEYSKKIDDGEIDDETFYYSIYEADKDCDLFDTVQWVKSNPALGCFKKIDDFIRLAKMASVSKLYEPKFRRLYFNQHINTDNIKSAINMELWEKAQADINIGDFRGFPCYAGLDFSSTNDITAFLVVFYNEENDKFYVFPFMFTPKDTLTEREKEDKNPYSAWVEHGDLIATDGRYVKFPIVLDKMKDLNEDFEFEQIGFDRWGSQTIINVLDDDFNEVVQLGQGSATMTGFINGFDQLLVDNRLVIQHNDLLTFMAKNCVAVYDDQLNCKFSKKKSKFKIDGIIAMLMGLGLAIQDNDALHYDAYEELEKMECWND